MSNPIPEIRALMERLAKVAEEAGFHVERAIINPEGPGFIEAILTVDPSMFKDDEQKQVDAEFEAMMKEQQIAERKAKLEKAQERAKTDLEKWLDGK